LIVINKFTFFDLVSDAIFKLNNLDEQAVERLQRYGNVTGAGEKGGVVTKKLKAKLTSLGSTGTDSS
jgi:hypothetical protein